MKPIVALMITGLLASTAALAQESKMAAPAPAAPAATTPSAEAPIGEHPATKKTTHHKKKKAHKDSMAKTEGDTKSGKVQDRRMEPQVTGCRR
jgi:hypothetical protein